jgi:branched-chain amino acid transport system permease protein
MFISDILALLVNGIAIGSVYAMVGVGLNIAYKPTNVFNLAQGEFVMLGAMLAWVFVSGAGLPWMIAAVAVVLLVGAFGMLEERLAVAPHFKASSHHHGWLTSTLAFSIIIINVADKIFRSEPQFVPPVPGTSTNSVMLGPLSFNTHQIAVVVLAILSIVALDLFYNRTMIGKSISAVSEDQDGARLNGINPLHITMLSFGAGAAYCAAAGILAAPLLLASTSLGLVLLVKGFMAMAVGGVGSNWGTLIGGILIGCVESVGSLYLSTGTRQVLLLVLLLAVLMARPQGILGKPLGRTV